MLTKCLHFPYNIISPDFRGMQVYYSYFLLILYEQYIILHANLYGKHNLYNIV